MSGVGVNVMRYLLSSMNVKVKEFNQSEGNMIYIIIYKKNIGNYWFICAHAKKYQSTICSQVFCPYHL